MAMFSLLSIRIAAGTLAPAAAFLVQAAVVVAVEAVNKQAGDQPHEEADPGFVAQINH
ncbi:hypothetical protein D3C71_1407900 [compost metagenome]